MKKFLSILLVPAFAILLAVPVFATSSFDESTAQTDNALTGDSPTTANIPIYGYIGQNADISDTDPSNPDTAPIITPNGTSISVTVPTKVIFAAFAENGGEISSPDYVITNNSKTSSVTVTLASFTANSGEDNSAVDPSLSLNLKYSYDAEKEESIFANGTGTTSPIEIVRCLESDQTGSSVFRNSMAFSLSGEYSGSFSADRTPSYEMVFRFDLY